jgi:hypothetical protein
MKKRTFAGLFLTGFILGGMGMAAFLFCGKTPPKFKFDQTKEGMSLVSDVGFSPKIFSPDNLEVMNFFPDGVEKLSGDDLMLHIRAPGFNLGQRHAEWLYEHQFDIPAEFRDYCFLFPGTVWHDPRAGEYDTRVVPTLCFESFIGVVSWEIEFYHLDETFGNHWRLLRVRTDRIAP